jgi:predicted DCC family thiol-disulfide oxidoreductase YuxK
VTDGGSEARTAESWLIFDGDCGFCTSAANWTSRRFHHGERAEAWQLLPTEMLERYGLTHHDLQEAAWWVDDTGLRKRGHLAVGRSLRANGGVWKVAGWLTLHPPTRWLASGVYRLVVRWRYRLPGGTPACKVARRESTG